MVEQVEDLGAELSVGSLCDAEALGNREVNIRVPWSVQRIAASERVLCGTRESAAGSSISGKRRHRRKERPERRSRCGCLQPTHVGTYAAGLSCPARTSIDIGTALVVAHAERKPAAPRNVSARLETANDVVGPFRDVGGIRFSMPERQFIHTGQDKHMLAVEVHQSVVWLDSKVVLVEIQSLRPGVVRLHL